MAYDEKLAARLDAVCENRPGMKGKKMFGGMGYLLNGNMCVGIHKNDLVVRVGIDQAEAMMELDHVGPMDITGRTMKGWALVKPAGCFDDGDLAWFVDLAEAFVNTLPPK